MPGISARRYLVPRHLTQLTQASPAPLLHSVKHIDSFILGTRTIEYKSVTGSCIEIYHVQDGENKCPRDSGHRRTMLAPPLGTMGGPMSLFSRTI